MKRQNLLTWLSFLLIVALVLAGCEKKATTEPDTTTPPIIPTVRFSSPSASGDQCTQMAYTYVQGANAMSVYTMMFAGQTPTRNGDIWTWQAVQGSLTVRVTATITSTGLQWQMILNGTDPDDGTVYNNWVALQGTSSADGKSGSWTIYEDNTTVIAAQFVWSTSSAGVLTGTFTGYDQGQQSYRLVAVSNANGSGSVTYSMYSNGQWVQQFNATWSAANGPATCS